jgi:hypothetical protein
MNEREYFEKKKAEASERTHVAERRLISQDVKVERAIEKTSKELKAFADSVGQEKSYDSIVRSQTERYQRLKREGKL